ncbi:MAG: RNA polymerase sigma factor [Acidimicrobiales bacterium]
MTIGDRFEEVLAAAKRGEDHALEEIYRDLAPLVLAYLRSNGAREPEDLTSEVFVAVVRNIARFDGEETAFRSWVLTIAHRRLIDSFRHRSRRPEDPTLPDDVQAQMTPDLATAETEALDHLATAGLGDALSALTVDQRAVVTLRILADVPIKEVADILGKPETSIKSLQHRALASLARHVRSTQDDVDTGQYPQSDRER